MEYNLETLLEADISSMFMIDNDDGRNLHAPLPEQETRVNFYPHPSDALDFGTALSADLFDPTMPAKNTAGNCMLPELCVQDTAADSFGDILQYNSDGQASLKVEYVGNEQALTEAVIQDILAVDGRWLELRTEQEISTPSAIHADMTQGVVLYRAVCGACFDVVGNLSSQEFFESWYAHVRSCGILDHQLSPLGVYFSEPSDDEGANLEDIEAASYLTAPSLTSSRTASGSFARTTSVYSKSAGSVISWQSSVGSMGSVGSFDSLSQRRKLAFRHRHKTRKLPHSDTHAFQCTFCMASFTTAGNWSRHEEEVHLVLTKWRCAPDGSTTPGGACVYCLEQRDTSHCEVSCGMGCPTKPVEARTFSRKGHLKQHLQAVHNCTAWRSMYDCWKTKSALPMRSCCGFCGKIFQDWGLRKKHIAQEFQTGKKMRDWKGDWGFDEGWNARLDGAILPKDRTDAPPKRRWSRVEGILGRLGM